MMVLLFKASLVATIMLAFYKLFLEKESFFAVNRIFLVLSLVLCFTLPHVALPELVNNQGIVNSWLSETADKTAIAPLNETLLSGKGKQPGIGRVLTETDPNLKKSGTKANGVGFWLAVIYFFGLIVLSMNLFSQLISLLLRIRRNKDSTYHGKYIIIHAEAGNGPCSFFNYIFIDPEKYSDTTYEQILEHEKTHVLKRHSFDLLLAEVAIIILWFNPFIWLFRKEIEKNIEYQTDAILLDSQTVESENYQRNLLAIATEKKPLTIVSNYNQSLIKKRIIMMNSRKSDVHSYWKYAFIAPTLFATLLLLNQPFAMQAQVRETSAFAEERENEFEMEYDNDHSDDLPPLLKAAADGEEESVKLLISQGADVNTFAHGDGTALYLALQYSNHEVAELLLEHGADPNLGSISDGYPIMAAVASGDLDMVTLLVKKGADVNRKFLGDGSALILASKTGNLAMVKLLVGLKADFDMGVKGDGNPLIMAAKGGHQNIVEYLVGLGADVNYEIPGDETPLINASEQGHLDVVKFLVEKGADVNKVCTELYNGKTRVRTALKMAEKFGHEDVVDYLKSKGAKK